jgi:hypothetical protein
MKAIFERGPEYPVDPRYPSGPILAEWQWHKIQLGNYPLELTAHYWSLNLVSRSIVGLILFWCAESSRDRCVMNQSQCWWGSHSPGGRFRVANRVSGRPLIQEHSWCFCLVVLCRRGLVKLVRKLMCLDQPYRNRLKKPVRNSSKSRLPGPSNPKFLWSFCIHDMVLRGSRYTEKLIMWELIFIRKGCG